GRARQVEISGVGVEDAPGMVGDEHAVDGIVDDRLEQRMAGIASREAQNTGGHGEQGKDADHAEDGKEKKNVARRVLVPDEREPRTRAREQERDQKDEADGAAA